MGCKINLACSILAFLLHNKVTFIVLLRLEILLV